MARGRNRGRGRGGGRGGNKSGKQAAYGRHFSLLSKKREFSEDGNSSKNTEGNHYFSNKRSRFEATQPTKEVSSDEESIEEQPVDHFKQLLSTFTNTNVKAQENAVDTESESSGSDASELEDRDLQDSNAASKCGYDNNSDEESENMYDGEDKGSSDSESSDSEQSDVADKTSILSRKEKSSIKHKDEPASSSSSESYDDGEDDGEEDEKEENEPNKELDPFARHLFYDLPESLYETVSKLPVPAENHHLNWPVLGQLVVRLPKLENDIGAQKIIKKSAVSLEKGETYAEAGTIPKRIKEIDLTEMCIKTQIQDHISKAKELNTEEGNSSPLTPLQTELFSVMNNYQDLYYPSRTLENGEEVRFAYVLHAVNHLLKTRDKILHHNAKISKKGDVLDEFRDQGLTRPKVVILVPFRDSALRVVKMIVSILFGKGKANVGNMKRFVDEYTGNEIFMPKFHRRPEDYEKLFSGNTDDSFRVGLKFNRQSLQLYSPFYSSDIIIASPLGLRVVVGAEGEYQRDFDFLASVELLVMDQTELFYMQNWDHLLHVMDHFHLQPKQSHDTDYSRVRSWALNGWARFYRQTLLFSSVILPEINALFNKKCHNYAGGVRVVNPIINGSICQIVVQIPLVFHRLESDSPTETIDARFELFTTEILPRYSKDVMSHTMFFIPSYFDFVRIRNYLKENLEFVQICEYTTNDKMSRARDIFFHTGCFMLYTERVHFFRRLRIKGIRHLVFYQLPSMPHFFSEICNFMESTANKITGTLTVTVLYSKYDIHQLSAITGIKRANMMMTSKQHVHMFVTAENN